MFIIVKEEVSPLLVSFRDGHDFLEATVFLLYITGYGVEIQLKIVMR